MEASNDRRVERVRVTVGPTKYSVAEIQAAEKLWGEAARTGDIEIYEKILSDDFYFIMHGGEVLNRSAFLLSVKNGERKIKKMEFKEISIRFYNDTAVVIGTLDLSAEFHGKPFVGLSRITKVWFNENSIWKAVSFHASDARVRVEWESMITKKRT